MHAHSQCIFFIFIQFSQELCKMIDVHAVWGWYSPGKSWIRHFCANALCYQKDNRNKMANQNNFIHKAVFMASGLFPVLEQESLRCWEPERYIFGYCSPSGIFEYNGMRTVPVAIHKENPSDVSFAWNDPDVVNPSALWIVLLRKVDTLNNTT